MINSFLKFKNNPAPNYIVRLIKPIKRDAVIYKHPIQDLKNRKKQQILKFEGF